jgi:ABC-type transporter lipoprotein component MlaA
VAASDCVSKPMIGARSRQCAKRLASMTIGALAVTLMLVSTTCAQSAMGADQAAPLKVPGEGSRTPRMLPGEQGGPYPDPLEPFNQTMFNFNIDVDQLRGKHWKPVVNGVYSISRSWIHVTSRAQSLRIV